MVRAESITSTLVYTYSAQGLRVAQSVDGDVTTFAWDWASGLPEMLREGASVYLVGHETLGQWDGATWTFHLPDALGSVRQVADGVGAVVSAREWTPYGVEVGAAQQGLGYTGEWHNGYIEFTYLRARWYKPQTGRFVNPDPIVPDFWNPQSINGYVYVLGNPVNYTDPSGLCLDTDIDGICDSSEPDPRDLTDWLYREMIHNSNDPIVRNLRTWNDLAKGGEGIGMIGCGVGIIAGQPLIIAGGGVVIAGGMVFHGVAYYQFKQQVEDHARWDFKHRIKQWLGEGITLCHADTSGCENDIEYSVPGNIHFGYIGRAAKFWAVEIHIGAGVAEYIDPSHNPEHPEYTPYPGTLAALGDEPSDYEAVGLGIRLYDQYGEGLTYQQLKQELGSHIGSFARHVPKLQSVPDWIASAWPYPVGYFDPPK